MMAGLCETDLMFKRWRRHRKFYELDLLNAIRKRNVRGKYIDIGANLGNHSVFFANFCKATSLLALEAHPEIYKVLCENLARHIPTTVPRVSANFAVMDHDGQHVTMGPINPNNVGSTSICSTTAGAIPTITLDTLVGDSVDVAVIKMDIEGYERYALAGALFTIDRCRPLVAMEAGTDEELQDLNAVMQPRGYEIVFRTKKNPASYLWVPKE